ncbi:MAG: hypothetical protein LIO44_07425, partial [Eubacterium sp.]|nr:hypothetical protein [Eubacterium sp.]
TVSFSLENYLADNVSVRIHGKKIVCRCMQSHYEFKYKPEKNENSVSANVYVNSDNIGDFKFTIKQGISKNSIFDLL